MHNRIKSLRKELNLTQEKFGERLGMKKNSISQIENGINALTEQLLVSICREFGVNEKWLRTGEGDMFLPLSDSQSLDTLAKANHATEADYQLIRNYLSLDSTVRLQIQTLFSTKE